MCDRLLAMLGECCGAAGGAQLPEQKLQYTQAVAYQSWIDSAHRVSGRPQQSAQFVALLRALAGAPAWQAKLRAALSAALAKLPAVAGKLVALAEAAKAAPTSAVPAEIAAPCALVCAALDAIAARPPAEIRRGR